MRDEPHGLSGSSLIPHPSSLQSSNSFLLPVVDIMKVGIVGFAGSGKSTVFQWLTGAKPDPAKIQTGQTGNAKIHDDRLDWLSAKFSPKKTTPAALDFLDTPGLLADERRDNPRRLGILRESYGLLVVL